MTVIPYLDIFLLIFLFIFLKRLHANMTNFCVIILFPHFIRHLFHWFLGKCLIQPFYFSFNVFYKFFYTVFHAIYFQRIGNISICKFTVYASSGWYMSIDFFRIRFFFPFTLSLIYRFQNTFKISTQYKRNFELKLSVMIL